MSKKFDYGKAEADLWDVGCSHSEDIYSYRTEKGIKEFMREEGLNPDNYYKNSGSSKNSGSKSSNDNGGCYLTTACVRAKGMADDCDDLTTLRNYRDTYLASRENGKKDIAYYYKTAPSIVKVIDGSPDSAQIWCSVYESLVTPCVKLIKSGKPEQAYELYKSYTLMLEEKYLTKQ